MKTLNQALSVKILLLVLFTAVALLAPVTHSTAQTMPTAQALPYSQNFSTFNGSQTTYPAGLQGWVIGTNQAGTFRADGPTANFNLLGGTNATTTAGVYDMNGKIGFLSSGSNERAVGLAIVTTSTVSINVSYLAGTQAQISAGRIDELGVQYRLGTSGTWTNIAGSTYQNNATSTINTGNAASNTQTVSFTLPSACENQAVVQLRWLYRDVSGSGNRPSFSVDDISIAGTVSSTPTIGTSTGSLSGDVTNSGIPSLAANTYTVSGSNLTNDISLSVTGNFQISTSPTSGFGTSLTLTQTGGNVATTTIYTRLSGAGSGAQSGSISHTSTGASTQTVNLSGTVIAPTLTEVIVPQYMQGLSGTNANRVPYAYRVTLTGLTANATYKYFNSVVNYTDNAIQNGSGNCIFPTGASWGRTTGPDVATAGNHNTFTTDGSGNYTGWFVTEPSGNARFTTGGLAYLRINLNDGAGGTTVVTRITAPTPATVINLATGANGGAPIYGNSFATAKNFVFLYDNTAGSGRPISGTFVESDGTANTTGNSYASFYGTSVEAVGGAWGAIIPNSPGLPNGIRRIEQRDITSGSVTGCAATDADGSWTSGANTVNPTGGTTAIVITACDAPLDCTPSVSVNPTSLSGYNTPSGTASAAQSYTLTGANLTANVLVTAPTDYEVSLTLGSGYGNTVTVNKDACNNVAATLIYVRIKASALAGTPSGNVTNVAGAASQSVAVSGTVTGGPSPSISATPSSLSGFTTPSGTPSAFQSYSVSGANLTNDIVINSSANYQISLTSGSGYTNTITLTQSGGSVTSTTVYVRLTGSGTGTVNGTIANTSTGAITQNVSTSGSITASLTEVYLPKYIQGLSGTNSNRLPYAFRVTLGGLLPGATYRYFNQIIDSTDNATAAGAGNVIFVNAGGFTRSTGPSLSSAGNFGTFTTDASGAYTGWFASEATGNARFAVGHTVNMRISLNDGISGTTVVTRLTTTGGARVIDLVSGRGTPIYSTSSGTARNFVLLFDNTAGTGRPIAGTYIESDGVANTTGNSFASFYSTNVEAQAGRWGTIIPAGTQLPSGITRIEQRALTDGSLVGCARDADGVWPTGSVNTVNTTGGNTALVIANADAPLTSCVTTNFVTLSVSAASGDEATSTVITVSANTVDPVTGAQTVDLGVTGTNVTGGDYSLSNTTITIANGATSGSVTFTVSNDAVVEGNETAVLTISNPSSGIVIGSPSTQNITLVDDDVPAVSLSVSSNTTAEGGVAVTVTATATTAVIVDETVDVTVTAGTAIAADYALTDGDGGQAGIQIKILNGQTTGSITFTAADDNIREVSETAQLTINNPSSGIGLGTPLNQTITISDNDDAFPLLVLNTVSATITFDELENTGSAATTMPRGSYYLEAGTNANATYRAGDGSVSTGDTYSFGTGTNSDRAFGSITSGSLTPDLLGLKLTNNTGTTINAMIVEYNGEQWRNGAANNDALAFQYSLNATSLNSGIYATSSNVSFNSLNAGGTDVATDGNNVANRVLIKDTIYLNGGVADGVSFWVRWSDADVTGSDDGLGVDDLKFTPLFVTPSVFYSTSAGNLDQLASWGNQPDGSGLNPTNFTASGQTFIITNRATATIAANWAVSGLGSIVKVETGTTFVVPATFSYTGKVDVNAGSTLQLFNTVIPTLNVLDPTSTIIYKSGAFDVQDIFTAATYGNLEFNGAGEKRIVGDIRVEGDLTYDNVNMDADNAGFWVIKFKKDITLSGIITYTGNYLTNVNLLAYGSNNQHLVGNGQPVKAGRLYMNVNPVGSGLLSSGPDFKTGLLDLSAANGGTDLELTDDIKLNASGTSFFLDNGNTITVGGDVECAGTNANYTFTGTVIVNAATGTANFRQDGSAGSQLSIKADLNNVTVQTSGNTTAEFKPTSGSANIIIKGNFIIGGTSTGKVTPNGNTIKIAGNFTDSRTIDMIAAGTSTFEFNGTGAQTISTAYSQGESFNNVTINNAADVDLAGDIRITGSGVLNVASGKLNTNAKKVILNSGASITETSSTFVLGTVETTRTLALNTNSTFGGLGIEVNAHGAAPGNTLCRRVTGSELTVGCGGSSILRYFDLTPTVNTGLNATVVFHYFQTPFELNGFNETDLSLFKSVNNGVTWVGQTSSVTAASDIITANSQASLARFSAATAQPQSGIVAPVYGIVCPGNSILLSSTGSKGLLRWQSSPNNVAWSDIAAATNSTYTATPGAKTYYRLVANYPGCLNIASNTSTIEISSPAFTVNVTAKTDQTLTLDWAPVGSGNYNLSYTGASSNTINNVTPPKVLTGLVPGGNYNITITQTGVTGCTATGNVTAATLCGVPTAVTATATSGSNSSLNVSWTGAVANYRVFYRPLFSSNTYATKDVVNAISTTLTKFGANNLSGGTTYEIYVTRLDCPTAGVLGAASALAYGTTTPALTCAAPVIDSVKSVCPTQLQVYVHGSPTNQYQIYLQRLTPTVQAVTAYPISGGVLSVNIGSAGQTYLIAAVSKCASSLSNIVVWSGGMTVKPQCNAINNLLLSDPTCTGFSASWNADNCLSNTVSYYQVYIRQQGTIVWNSYPVTQTFGSPFVNVNWLSKSRTYECYVRSVYACNGFVAIGPASNTYIISTLTAGCRMDEGSDVTGGSEVSALQTNSTGAFSIYPNPSNGQFKMDISRTGTDEQPVSVEVMNVMGQVVMTYIAQTVNGSFSEYITMPDNAAAGTYMVRATVGTDVYTGKVNISK